MEMMEVMEVKDVAQLMEVMEGIENREVRTSLGLRVGLRDAVSNGDRRFTLASDSCASG